MRRTRSPQVMPATCVTPACTRATKPGSRFCVDCSLRLARIRAEVAVEGNRRHRSPMGNNLDRVKVKRGATCCNPACLEPRIPPAAFCPQCESEGWGVEDE